MLVPTGKIIQPVFVQQARDQQLFNDGPINVRAAKKIVSAMIDDMDAAFLRLDERSVERAAAKIINEPVCFLRIDLKSIGQGRSNWLLQKRAFFEAGELCRFP